MVSDQPQTPIRLLAEDELLSAYGERGEVACREELIRRFLPLARRLAHRYSSSPEAMEDLEQVASLALVRAVDRFDPAIGVAFKSYAIPSILGELKRYFRDHSWAARVPRPVQERLLKVTKAGEELSAQLGRSPSIRELAAAVRATPEEVLEALEARTAFSTESMDSGGPEGDGGEPRGRAETLGGIDDSFDLVECRATLKTSWGVLPERERHILKMRFVDDMTQSDIADVVGVSQMQVSRLIRKALTQVREVADPEHTVAAA